MGNSELVLDGFTCVSALLRSGVYALAYKAEIVYVGKSKNLYQRIYTHRTIWNRFRQGKRMLPYVKVKPMQFDQIFIHPCPAYDLDMIERRMIDRYRPKHNERLMPVTKISAPISLNIRGLAITLNGGPSSRPGPNTPAPAFERRI